MLPAPLVGAYQQYKADTDAVAAWLASTAVAHGYSLDRPQNSDATENKPTVTGRLKGKARKDAKRAAENQTKARRTYRIAMKDFVILSEHIATKNVPVPSSFVSTLNRLIRIRQSFGERLENHGDVLDESSDQAHSFFISILETVRRTLRPWFSISDQASDHTNSTEPLAETTNRFAGLFVHEPSDQFLNAPDIERPKQAARDTNVYHAEHLKTVGEARMAFLLVMVDLNRIRNRITWIWENYQIRIFDLISAAIASNTAIELARSIIAEVIPLVEANGGVEAAINVIFRSYMKQTKEPFTSFDLVFSKPVADYPFVHPEHHSLHVDSYGSAYTLVRCFHDSIDYTLLSNFNHSKLPYDPASDRAAKTGRQKFDEDRHLLESFLSDISNMHAFGITCLLVNDEIIHGMQELARTGEIPFYLVFAAQVYLDIHHVLRCDATRAFDTLKVNLISMRTDMVKHLELHGSYTFAGWSKPINDEMSECISRIDRILADPVYESKFLTYRLSGVIVPEMERNRMLKLSPILSGLALFSFTVKHQNYGLYVEQHWDTVMLVAHLHNALHNEKLLTSKWHDMMIVRALFEDSSFFVGSPPTTRENYLSRLQLQLGLSATAFSINARESSGLAMNKKLRRVRAEEILSVSNMFIPNYVSASVQKDWTADMVNQVSKLSRYRGSDQEKSGLTFTLSEDQTRLIEISQTLVDSKTRRQRNKVGGTQLTPDLVIYKLVHALNNEKLGLAFPWLMMHHSCWSFLQAIKYKADECLRSDLSVQLLPRRTLEHAFEGDMSLMHMAAEVARDYYVNSGSKVFREPRERGISIQLKANDVGEGKEYEEMFFSGVAPNAVHGNCWVMVEELQNGQAGVEDCRLQ